MSNREKVKEKIRQIVGNDEAKINYVMECMELALEVHSWPIEMVQNPELFSEDEISMLVKWKLGLPPYENGGFMRLINDWCDLTKS